MEAKEKMNTDQIAHASEPWKQWRKLLHDGNPRALCWNCGYPELIGSDDCRNCGTNFDPATRIDVGAAHASEPWRKEPDGNARGMWLVREGNLIMTSVPEDQADRLIAAHNTTLQPAHASEPGVSGKGTHEIIADLRRERDEFIQCPSCGWHPVRKT